MKLMLRMIPVPMVQGNLPIPRIPCERKLEVLIKLLGWYLFAKPARPLMYKECLVFPRQVDRQVRFAQDLVDWIEMRQMRIRCQGCCHTGPCCFYDMKKNKIM